MNRRALSTIGMLGSAVLLLAVLVIIIFALKDRPDTPGLPECESALYDGKCVDSAALCPSGMVEQPIQIKEVCPEGEKCCVP